ncbi:hypothetical protein AAC387_Pa01g0102 [Persea americana]
MAPPNTVEVLELSRVAPPPGSVSEASLPLTFFDVFWIVLPPVQRLFFYEFSPTNTTTSHFFNSLLPHLKHSLSLALQLFYPLAGNLILSPQTGEHEVRYVEGDSISFTVAESTADFHQLMAGERVISVAGSPKFRVYDTDFGWGRPRKTEVLSIEKTEAIYMGESRYEEGGIEIGMALSKSEMEGFAYLFEEGLV